MPKEKANELVNTMLEKLYNNEPLSFKRILHARAVECAKVLANEMLFQYKTLNADKIDGLYRAEKIYYWETVRKELDNIES